ncbi:ABC transporter ATP-binding protein, partial [Escherichia coli]|nr:ABC transporter ATP-binding protein [Escherichia coli]
PYARVAAGRAYVPEGRDIFPRLTVEENLLGGAASRKAPSKVPDRIYDLFPVLKDMRARRGGALSGGQQQQPAI